MYLYLFRHRVARGSPNSRGDDPLLRRERRRVLRSRAIRARRQRRGFVRFDDGERLDGDRTSFLHREFDDRRVESFGSDRRKSVNDEAVVKKRLSPQRHNDATEEQRSLDEHDAKKLTGMEYVDYLIQKTEEMTRRLNESTDSEGICADYRNPSSGRGSMTSSSVIGDHNSQRMFFSTMSTPRRTPSRIPALMTKSLCAPRSMSTPQRGINSAYGGSGEQLCDGFLKPSRFETEMLLSRSQERRRHRASSYDPRCLLALQPSFTATRLCTSTSASASASASPHLMTSSYSASSFSRLLPKRPQWTRHQPTPPSAESLISLDSICKKLDGFESDSDFDPEEVHTPKSRRKMLLCRKIKDKNRRKFSSSIRRLRPPAPPKNAPTIPTEFFCVTSPFFYLVVAFLFRFLLFLIEIIDFS
uniref:Uncharacterized protein n=1 Tax=Caenorhabditis japonica TaxID=281687 RepID=A0A8R1I1S7_CAEJA